MSQAKILTDREYRKVLVYIANHRHASRNKAMLYMSHLAGLRVGEISHLTIEDDFSTNKMSLAVNEISTVNGARSYKLKVVTNKDMVLTDFSSMPGTKKAVVTSPDLGGAVEVLIIPVNSGNTLLIQGLSFGSSGICQKV